VWILAGAVTAAACSVDDRTTPPAAGSSSSTVVVGSTVGSALPDGPAACVGAERDPSDGRSSLWRRTAEIQDEFPDLWFSLSRTYTIDEALSVAVGLDFKGEVFVLPFNQGTVLKGSQDAGWRGSGPMDGSANPTSSELRGLLQTRISSTLESGPSADPGVVEAKRLVAAGDIPIGAIRLQGSRGRIRTILEQRSCDVYAIAPGDSAQLPLLSPAVDPT